MKNLACGLLLLVVSKTSFVKADSGCYHPSDHHCDCKTEIDQTICESSNEGGIWTDECNCSRSEQPESPTKEGEEQDRDDKSDSESGELFTQTTPQQAAGYARWILHESKWGTLTTASGGTLENSGHDSTNPDESQPLFANILPYATDKASGRLFFYLMNERRLEYATLTVSQASINPTLFPVAGCGLDKSSVVDAQDPRCAKISVSGAIHPCSATHSVNDDCEAVGLAALFASHPTMPSWPEDHHFTVHELMPAKDGFWMLANFGGGSNLSLEQYTNVDSNLIVPHPISGGDSVYVPPPTGNGRPSDMPSWHQRAQRARWIVHKSLWCTVSTLKESGDGTFGNIRSVTDGTTSSSSTGLPVFYVPDVDPTAVDMNANSMQVALSFSEAAIYDRVTDEGLSCAGQDVGMPTCAQVILYGTAQSLPVDSQTYKDALKNFDAKHPLAPWLSQGGSHMGGKYYTINPSRISILDFFGGAVDLDVEEYLSLQLCETEAEENKIFIPSSFVMFLLGFAFGCVCGFCCTSVQKFFGLASGNQKTLHGSTTTYGKVDFDTGDDSDLELTTDSTTNCIGHFKDKDVCEETTVSSNDE